MTQPEHRSPALHLASLDDFFTAQFGIERNEDRTPCGYVLVPVKTSWIKMRFNSVKIWFMDCFNALSKTR